MTARKTMQLAPVAGLLLVVSAPASGSTHRHSPEEGALVGPRPALVLLVDDFKGTLRYTIELSHDHFKEDVRSWDMRKTMRNWAVYNEDDGQGAMFTVPEDLAEGTWWWRAIVHDGPADSGPDFVASFKVDSTPPAEVEDLKVVYDRETRTAKLRWHSVSTDVSGDAETVSHYRVYCYDKRGIFPQGNLKLLGTTETESFVDPKGPNSPTPIAYYRVTAVDSVGNETAPPKNPWEAEKPPPRERGKRPEGEAGGRRQRGQPPKTMIPAPAPAPTSSP